MNVLPDGPAGHAVVEEHPHVLRALLDDLAGGLAQLTARRYWTRGRSPRRSPRLAG